MNIWAVLVATLSTVVVGSVWYTPAVLGNRWRRLADLDAEGAGERGVFPIVITVLVSLISAYALAVLATLTHYFYGGSFLGNTILISAVAWGGFTGARFITHDSFEGRPVGLTTINIAHELVTFLVMALIIGAFGAPG